MFIRRTIPKEFSGRGYEVRLGDTVISSGRVSEDGTIGFWFIPSRMGDNPISIFISGISDPVDEFTVRVSSPLFGEEVKL